MARVSRFGSVNELSKGVWGPISIIEGEGVKEKWDGRKNQTREKFKIQENPSERFAEEASKILGFVYLGGFPLK